MLTSRIARLAACAVFACAVCLAEQPAAPPQPRREVTAALENFIQQEMAAKQLPAAAIALVEGDRIIWSRGFGGATPGTLFRAGSVSKLITGIALMQLVEQGRVNLDLPIGRFLPDLRPRNPFPKSFTLRQLMAHRSGLVREPPLGSYFDSVATTLEQAVLSLNTTELVYEPGTRTKYSNAGVTVAGCVVERLLHEPFARAMREHVLDPLRMEKSTFETSPWVAGGLSKGLMWTYDGRQFEAPKFGLNISPAGGLSTTILDLAQFARMLIARGQGPESTLIRRETLEEMWRPQSPAAAAGAAGAGARSFGVGFMLSDLAGHRVVGHSGAAYGFATELEVLADDGLGVVVYVAQDGANGVTTRIARTALEWLLLAREAKILPPPEITRAVPPETGAALAGRYRTAAGAVDLEYRNGKLYATPAGGASGMRNEVRLASGGGLMVDDALAFGTRLEADAAKRLEAPRPQPLPARWIGLVGEYGWDYNTLYVLERDGRLTALVEWFFYAPLEEVNTNTFHLRTGLYEGEDLSFTRDARGRAVEAVLGGVRFPRRPDAAQPGGIFRITPLKPVAVLRQEAAAAHPPAPKPGSETPDLVDVTALEPGIKLDIRYATDNNFMGTPFYSQARALLQRPAAEALVRAHRALAAQGYGLLVYDAYRPWYVTYMFWEATPPERRQFVADPAEGSRHNRGCAVDLTLYDLRTGRGVTMPSGYDEMSTRAYPDYPGGAALERWQRDLLRRVMEAQGFQGFDFEWWHFDYRDWARYPVLNLPLEQIR